MEGSVFLPAPFREATPLHSFTDSTLRGILYNARGGIRAMIDNLKVGKTANFYEIGRRLSGASIADLFRLIRSTTQGPSQNLFKYERERSHGATWSALSFFHEKAPAFLRPPPTQAERVCGFILLVEHRNHIAVFKSGLDIPLTFKSRHFSRIPIERVEAATAQTDAVFEKIKLRNMSPSKLVLRSKTLESSNLSNAVGQAGAKRYAPQSYATRRGSTRYSTTLNSGRIAERSDISGHVEAIEWACSIIDQLIDAQTGSAPFMKSFARPLDLASAGSALRPRIFSVNTAPISEALFDTASHRLVQRVGPNWIELSAAEANALLERLDEPQSVRIVRKEWRIVNEIGDKSGELKLSARRISLRSLEDAQIKNTWVESTSHLVGADPERTSFRIFIDRNDYFVVLFEDSALSYLSGDLFRDDALAAGDEALLRNIIGDARLTLATSEKGAFVPAQTQFDLDSIFGIITTDIARTDTVLVCDDLSDEWADFIGLEQRGNLPVLSFYHAKHGPNSLGASPLHVVASQAMKNLGNLALPSDSMAAKIASWVNNYNAPGVATQISRTVRGGSAAALSTAFQDARLAPAILKRVCIVSSSLSRQEISAALSAIRLGHAPTCHFVQLYWLLLTFFTACTEVGASGWVICRT